MARRSHKRAAEARSESSSAKPGGATSTKPRRALPAFRGEWIAAAFAFVLIAWLVTEGDWSLFKTSGHLEAFYDAQAQSLLHGRWDVAPESIGNEAFVHDGKKYGYFGPTPALFRIPLVLLLPGMYGRWSRSSMLAATALVLWALLALLRTLETQFPNLARERLWAILRPALVLAAAIGSTHFFICAESKVYQESIVWGASLALAHSAFLIRYLTGRGDRWLYLSCAAGLLAFFARVSSGFGPIFAIFVLDLALALPLPRFREYWAVAGLARRGRAMAACAATLAASVAGWAALNYFKFGRVFTSQPIELKLEFTPERLARVKGNIVALANLPMCLWAYLSPTKIRFDSNFPWVFGAHYGRAEVMARFPQAHLDYVEFFAGIPAAMPALFAAALAGTALCFGPFRKELEAFRVVLIGALAGCGLFLVFGMLTLRYEHDAFPWIVTAAAVGLACLVSIERQGLRRALAALFLAATLWSMWANFAFALVQQNLIAKPVPPAKWSAFADLSVSTSSRGVRGLFAYLRQTRLYLSAASFESGNLQVDKSEFAPRDDQSVVRSAGAPPYGATYSADIPVTGDYELSIRCASPEPRPVLLSINGRPTGYACAAATGGSGGDYQRWFPSGRYHLEAGRNSFAVVSNKPFPYINMFRFVRVE